MARIPTLIPQTLANIVRRAFRGSTADTVWKLFVLVLFMMVGVGLIAAGPVGYIIGGIIIGGLLTEAIQGTVADVWNRNFWVFKP